jgi:hypothetical protein
MKLIFVLLAVLLMYPIAAHAYQTQHVVVILIDGVRYTESLGDTTHTYAPRMWALSQLGAVQDSAFNDSVTVTNFGIPATWMGRFWPLQDTTYQGNSIQFCRYPTVWEYARHDLGLPIEKTIYVTPDYGSSTWQPSFYPGYGPSYWPHMVQPTVSDNNNQADFDSSIVVLHRDHPVVSYIYLPDTDHAGHSGVWADYLAKIRQADSLVDQIWINIQTDSILQNKTTMIVTDDHGRHDDTHGGFRNHGDSCFGCRHVMLWAIGPDIAHGVHLNTPRASIRDIAHTAGELLGFATPLSPGRILTELLAPPDTCHYILGDVNNSGIFTGLDVTYSVRYFKGGPTPLYSCECPIGGNTWYIAGDVNGSCSFSGLDVTYMVRYFKGGAYPIACPACPPAG